MRQTLDEGLHSTTLQRTATIKLWMYFGAMVRILISCQQDSRSGKKSSLMTLNLIGFGKLDTRLRIPM